MKFSIVIPLYNKEKQIARTLESVFAQTVQDYEIVIVNDGSTDGSAEVVESIRDPRIRLIYQQNAGVAAARNLGIAEASGEYIALLDADDEWKPTYLETISQLIEKYPKCDVFATNYEFLNESTGKVTPTILNNIPFVTPDGILTNYFQVGATSHPPIWTSAVCASKKALQSVGGFPIGVRSGEDLLCWAKLASSYQIAYCMTPLAVFHVEGYERSDKPKRIPAEFDVVGQELVNLKKIYNPPFINEYISFWHKMRSVIYLRLGMKAKSAHEATKALRWNPLNTKAYILLGLDCIPQFISKRILK